MAKGGKWKRDRNQEDRERKLLGQLRAENPGMTEEKLWNLVLSKLGLSILPLDRAQRSL